MNAPNPGVFGVSVGFAVVAVGVAPVGTAVVGVVVTTFSTRLKLVVVVTSTSIPAALMVYSSSFQLVVSTVTDQVLSVPSPPTTFVV